MDAIKNPYAVLLAKLSGLTAPPKARQAYQQFMHESYRQDIDDAVKKAWLEKIRNEHAPGDTVPNAAFRAKVARDVFQKLPAEVQAKYAKKAKDEAAAAKAAYEDGMKNGPPKTLQERQRCIDEIPSFLGPIISGIQAKTKLKFFIMYGGPFPCDGGKISTNHINYGTNLEPEPVRFFQWKRELFDHHVVGHFEDWLRTCYTQQDIEEATFRPTEPRTTSSLNAGPESGRLNDFSNPTSDKGGEEVAPQKKSKKRRKKHEKDNNAAGAHNPHPSQVVAAVPLLPPGAAHEPLISLATLASLAPASEGRSTVAAAPLMTGPATARPATPSLRSSEGPVAEHSLLVLPTVQPTVQLTVAASPLPGSPGSSPSSHLPYSFDDPTNFDDPLLTPDTYEQAPTCSFTGDKRALSDVVDELQQNTQPLKKKRLNSQELVYPRLVSARWTPPSMMRPLPIPTSQASLDSPMDVDLPPMPPSPGPPPILLPDVSDEMNMDSHLSSPTPTSPTIAASEYPHDSPKSPQPSSPQDDVNSPPVVVNAHPDSEQVLLPKDAPEHPELGELDVHDDSVLSWTTTPTVAASGDAINSHSTRPQSPLDIAVPFVPFYPQEENETPPSPEGMSSHQRLAASDALNDSSLPISTPSTVVAPGADNSPHLTRPPLPLDAPNPPPVRIHPHTETRTSPSGDLPSQLDPETSHVPNDSSTTPIMTAADGTNDSPAGIVASPTISIHPQEEDTTSAPTSEASSRPGLEASEVPKDSPSSTTSITPTVTAPGGTDSSPIEVSTPSAVSIQPRKEKGTLSPTTEVPSQPDPGVAAPPNPTIGTTPKCPQAAPKWLHESVARLTKPSLGPEFSETIRLFVAIETAHGFSNPNRGLAANRRPRLITKWIAAGRWRARDPSVVNPREFGEEWWEWWAGLQPPWREVDEEVRGKTKKRLVKRDVYGEDWTTLMFPGQNGVLSVVAGLCWWGVGVRRDGVGSGLDEWVEAVGDVNWVLRGLLAYLAKVEE